MELTRTPRKVEVLVVLTLAAAIGPRAHAAEPGDLWETTVEMSGMGMKMPATTTKSCRPKGSQFTEPPMGPQNESCEVLDWNLSGGKASWKMRCEGGISGEGTMTFEGQDRYSGAMSMTMPQGSMSMVLSGRRVGDCDASETRATMKRAEEAAAAAPAQAAAAMQQLCIDGARGGMTLYFLGENAVCHGAEEKKLFCGSLRTPQGYSQARQSAVPGAGFDEAATFCGTTAEALATEVCNGANAKKDYEFLAKECPELARGIAEAECAGRSFTSMPSGPVKDFCVRYAATLIGAQAAPDAAPTAEEKKEEGAMGKSKKALKKVFGH